MKIIINTNSLLTPLTGIGQYTYQISKALKEMDQVNQYTYYYGFFSKELFYRAYADSPGGTGEQRKIEFYKQMKTFIKGIPVVGTMGRSLRTAFSKTLQFLTRRTFDLYFEPNFIPLDEIIAKKVVTMVFDLSVTLHPEWHPQERIEIFKEHFQKGLDRSDIILTSTYCVRREIIEHLHIPESKIYVTPISCNQDIFYPQPKDEIERYILKNNLPSKFLLFVGSIEPRKNVLGLLKAYQQLSESVRKDLHIVFCGPGGWKNDDVFQFIKENDLQNRMITMKYVKNEDLSLLYSNAAALVYPSFYEGFGLPPLEAMSCGCPVIASDIPPHREVCGGAVLYVDPFSPRQITEHVEKLFADPNLREVCREKGLAQSKKFSWKKASADTLKVFDVLLAELQPVLNLK